MRTPEQQALVAIEKVFSRPPDEGGPRVGIPTRIAWQRAYQRAAFWLAQEHDRTLAQASRAMLCDYLGFVARHVGTSELGNERRALERYLRERTGNPAVALVRLKSTKAVPERPRVTRARAYSCAQVELIAEMQDEANALSTRLVLSAGVSASELLSLARLDDRRILSPDSVAPVSPNRFAGRGPHVLYSVLGRKSLAREVAVSTTLVPALEARRRARPRTVVERGVSVRSYYDLVGGQNFYLTFVRDSTHELGWSGGIEGLRRLYARQRMAQLAAAGVRLAEALEALAQESGQTAASRACLGLSQE